MKAIISKMYIHLWDKIILILGILLSACQAVPTNSLTSPSTNNRQLSTSASYTYITAKSVSELTTKSNIVIIGEVTKEDDIINMARDGKDLTKPDPNLFEIGQIYDFEVSEYLKSDPNVNNARIIKVVQPQGIIVQSSQQPPNVSDIEKARSSEKYIPLNVSKQYLLFLVPLIGFPESNLYFTGIAYPWQFELVNNCAYPESPWDEASIYFQPKPINYYRDHVSNSINNNAAPTEPIMYPPPSSMQSTPECPSLGFITTPYP